MAKTITTIELEDSAGRRPMKFDILVSRFGIEIRPYGFGTCNMEDGTSGPVFIELHDGKPRVHIWGDINLEDPTYSVSLALAAESLRTE